jgi:hypothetical protein
MKSDTQVQQVKLVECEKREDGGWWSTNTEMTCWLPMSDIRKIGKNVFTLEDTGDRVWTIEHKFGISSVHRINTGWKDLVPTKMGSK